MFHSQEYQINRTLRIKHPTYLGCAYTFFQISEGATHILGQYTMNYYKNIHFDILQTKMAQSGVIKLQSQHSNSEAKEVMASTSQDLVLEVNENHSKAPRAIIFHQRCYEVAVLCTFQDNTCTFHLKSMGTALS